MGTADGPEEGVGVNAVRPAPPFALGWALAVVVEARHDVASTTVVCCAVSTTRGTRPEAFDATASRGSRSAQKSLHYTCGSTSCATWPSPLVSLSALTRLPHGAGCLCDRGRAAEHPPRPRTPPLDRGRGRRAAAKAGPRPPRRVGLPAPAVATSARRGGACDPALPTVDAQNARGDGGCRPRGTRRRRQEPLPPVRSKFEQHHEVHDGAKTMGGVISATWALFWI